jgi:hypothetical protein
VPICDEKQSLPEATGTPSEILHKQLDVTFRQMPLTIADFRHLLPQKTEELQFLHARPPVSVLERRLHDCVLFD